ncbi:hypothetical protein DA798_03380 [Lactobacillus sp. PFC-70]|nr:hypothetical protein DA798_03380 [Lactobacillus sp. PFC-70]
MQVPYWLSIFIIFVPFLLRMIIKRELSPKMQQLLTSNLITYILVLMVSILIINSRFKPISISVIFWAIIFNLLFDFIFYLISKVSH